MGETKILILAPIGMAIIFGCLNYFVGSNARLFELALVDALVFGGMIGLCTFIGLVLGFGLFDY